MNEDDETILLNAMEHRPVPTCAHPRMVLDTMQYEHGYWKQAWSCPDCGESGEYVMAG